MKRLSVAILMVVMILTAGIASAKITAEINGKKFDGQSYGEIISKALREGNSLKDVIKGAGIAGAGLNELILGMRSSSVSESMFVGELMSFGMSCKDIATGLKNANTPQDVIANVTLQAGCDQRTIAEALNVGTPGLGYTPADSGGTNAPSFSASAGRRGGGGFVSTSKF